MAYLEEGELLVIRQHLTIQVKKEEEQQVNIFHTRCNVDGKVVVPFSIRGYKNEYRSILTTYSLVNHGNLIMRLCMMGVQTLIPFLKVKNVFFLHLLVLLQRYKISWQSPK